MTAPATALRKTVLNLVHRRMGAKMVNFGGWDMPVEYSGIIAEHMATRTAAGLFDVSHMGEIEIRGHRALELVQYVTCNDASRLSVGQAQYSGLMTHRGTFVDDLLVHKISDEHYLLVVNAGNQDGDFAYIRENNKIGAQLEYSSDRYSQLAIQGPKALAILQELTNEPIASLKYYRFLSGSVDEVHCLIARTGYTGEDGFEIYFAPEHSEKLWFALLDAGEDFGLIPCGLGARNTLRLEAGMCLYGHEIDETTTPWEAGLAWICKPEKGEFLGRRELVEHGPNDVKRSLVGFEMRGRQIARDGCDIFQHGKKDGRVTSGSPAPFLKKNIGMAYVPPDANRPDTEIQIDIRGSEAPALIVPLPFYKRPK